MASMECLVCLLPFCGDDPDRLPNVLPCGHSACLGCMRRMPGCPRCREDLKGHPPVNLETHSHPIISEPVCYDEDGPSAWWCLHCEAPVKPQCLAAHSIQRVEGALQQRLKELVPRAAAAVEGLGDAMRAMLPKAPGRTLLLPLLAGAPAACRLTLERVDAAGRTTLAECTLPGDEDLIRALLCQLVFKGQLHIKQVDQHMEPLPQEFTATAAPEESLPVGPEVNDAQLESPPIMPEVNTAMAASLPVRPETNADKVEPVLVAPKLYATLEAFEELMRSRPALDAPQTGLLPVIPEDNAATVVSPPIRPEENAAKEERLPAIPEENAAQAGTLTAIPEENAAQAKSLPVRPELNTASEESGPEEEIHAAIAASLRARIERNTAQGSLLIGSELDAALEAFQELIRSVPIRPEVNAVHAGTPPVIPEANAALAEPVRPVTQTWYIPAGGRNGSHPLRPDVQAILASVPQDLLSHGRPIVIVTQKLPPLAEVDVKELSKFGPRDRKTEKEAELKRVQDRGVLRLVELTCNADPEWVMRLLRAAIGTVNELQLLHARHEHIQCVVANYTTSQLKRLDLHADRSVLRAGVPMPVPDIDVGLSETDGVCWLRAYGLPLHWLSDCFLWPNSYALRTLWLQISVRPRRDAWPPGCGDLGEMLSRCGGRHLTKVVLCRPCSGETETLACARQKAKVRRALPACEVQCKTCDAVVSEAF